MEWVKWINRQRLQWDLSTDWYPESVQSRIKTKSNVTVPKNDTIVYLNHIRQLNSNCLSIPPENIKKPKGFLFSGVIEKQIPVVMGSPISS